MEKKGLVFWFTGLSGSGKTTVALSVKPLLEERGFSVLILDGDDIREKMHTNLGFSAGDIKKNNGLIADLCRLRRKDYDVIMVPVISPYNSSRKEARELLGKGFYEVYCSADLETVVKRDVKGLYSKAKNGEICRMIGYSTDAVYERPQNPDFVVDSVNDSIEESVNNFYRFIKKRLSCEDF